MPVFEYKCSVCGHSEDRIRKWDVTQIECAECGGQSDKQVSAPKHVNGGFYDNRPEATEVRNMAENFERKTGQTIGGGD